MRDRIRREDAIDVIKQATIHSEDESLAVEALENLPSAEHKGKWIEVDDADNRISGRCSNCGWEAHLYEDDVIGMPYCPNCGADMRGEEDGRDN